MRRKKITLSLSLLALSIVLVGSYALFMPRKATSPAPEQSQYEEVIDESEPPLEIEPAKPALIDVQPLIDDWAKGRRGTYGIVVYDLENEQIIGQANKNEVFFAASLYKLYVAYEGYLAIQNGDHKLNDPYLNGFTREECLDKMIRESDSPCAEKLWVELGKTQLNDTLRTYGLTNTSMTNITTTAGDINTMLVRIWNTNELKDTYKDLMLTSMKNQIYQDALAQSFDSAIFYDKVGFRGYDEYHDIGILSLPNGRHYAVSMLTDEIGTRGMQEFGDMLIKKLNAPN